MTALRSRSAATPTSLHTLFLLPREPPDPHSLSQVKEAGRVVFLVSKLHRLTARLPPPASRLLPPVRPTVHLPVQRHVFWPIEFGGKPRSSSPLLFGYCCDKKGDAVGVGTCTVARTSPYPPPGVSQTNGLAAKNLVGGAWRA